MKNEIINEVYDRLRDVYGQNPPARIINRFMSEKIMLSNQDTLLWMRFMGELFNKFREENIYFEMREAGIGASFIGWIMGVTNVNPLPPHYYCPNCKKSGVCYGQEVLMWNRFAGQNL